MRELAVVVLNYVNYQETICCINSILNQKEVAYHVIAVDNGSPNESYNALREVYKKNKLVNVIKAGKNYGFAKGNNIGINYARKMLSTDFVLLLNSDTELTDELYLKKMMENYKPEIGVIGSRIIERNGSEQKRNLGYVCFPDTLIYYLSLIFGYVGFPVLKEKILQKLKNRPKTNILHGSNLMLTPSFFRYYSGLYDKTFLYCEEELLYSLCCRAHLKQIKVQSTSLFHKGKQSSRFLFQNRYSVRDRLILTSYKYVVWESFKNKIFKGEK